MPDTKIINICFHGIGTPGRELEEGESAYWITEEKFHWILDEIAGWPNVRLSFDDGNTSDIEFGLPALRQRDLTATFFVLAGRLETAGSLDPDGVVELRKHGMSIGSHGMDHRPWRGMDPATRDRELVEARARLAEISGEAVRAAALPLGRYDRRLLGDLRRLGYETVHTSDRKVARAGQWMQPRFSVRSDDTPASLRASALRPATPRQRARSAAVGLVKRLR
ncbi:polysaccharide deacetylase [Antricoccus suffuscus]|uniref:Polysaccharide deacetylase n=1 Tax=Antricoccus suffuscus TaxID=1629062 RepID=A0A2T1A1L6_9ACTN|nr:polysaccharide deacetylase family protein [Antricoccus suffuscus]PRZ42486.1 polysaccharide deacetylase [Antricoccus suffuscus]